MAIAEAIPAAPPTMALKPRQQAAFDAVRDCYRRGVRRQLVALPTGVGKCVTPDTLVWSTGLRRFGELWGEAAILGPEGPATVAGWYDDGERPGLRVTTAAGLTIDGTLNHRVRVRTNDGFEGWKRLRDLVPHAGQYLAVARGAAEFGNGHLAPDDAYLLGLFVADGCMVRSGATAHFQLDKHPAVIDAILPHVRRWKRLAGGGTDTLRVEHRSNEHASVHFTAAGLPAFLAEMGVGGDPAHTKRVPATVLRSDRPTVQWFLRGLFDGDGYCAPQVGYSTASAALADQVHQLLLGLGVLCGRALKHTSRRDAHVLSVWDPAAFAREVGFTTYGLTKDKAFGRLMGTARNSNADLVPGVGALLREAAQVVPSKHRRDDAWRHVDAYYSGEKLPSYATLRELVEGLPDDAPGLSELTGIVQRNYAYTEIMDIEPSTAHRIDCEVDFQHAFVGNGLVNHNTVLGAHIAKGFRRPLFLVPRQELIDQTVRTFERVAPGRRVGVLWQRRQEVDADIVVGMVQTAYARLDRLQPGHFDLIIVDEAHHAGARTWRDTLDHFETRLRLGLSATPERNDGTPLSNLFDAVAYRMTVAEAVDEGYLCRPVGLQVLTQVDISQVKVTAGDLNGKQLEEAIDLAARNELIARTYHQHAKGRRAIAFCAGVPHSQSLARVLTETGLRADWVSGDDPDRDAKIANLRAGGLDVLCNAMLLTEGFDDPSVSCILMARPTQSRPLYAQAVGRGLRLSPGKADCLIIDFVDNASRHSLATVWDWYGKRLKEHPGELVDLKSKADNREEQLKERAAEQMQFIFGCDLNVPVFVSKVDLLKPPPDLDLMAYGDRRWHYDPPTDKQLAALGRMGYDVETQDWTKGQASIAMGSAPASAKQLKLLLALGYDVLTQTWTRAQAAEVLDNAEDAEPDWTLVNTLQEGGRR